MRTSTNPQSDPPRPGGEPSRWTDAPTLLVVIVNYRTPDVTVACLRSLADEIPHIPQARVVVVDNGSGDGSAEAIASAIAREGWGAWAAPLALRDNGGFAYGNNRGIETAPNARHYLLLNSDTIVTPGAIRHCLEVLEADPAIGAMSCMLLNEDRSIQNVARRFPTPMRRAAGALGLPWRWPRLFGWADLDDLSWDRGTTRRDVDWLGGAFLLVRGDVLRRIGGLDEDFFFYGEDIALCARVWRAGARCHYDPRVSIVHLGGTSSDPSRLASGERLRHALRGRHLVHAKLYGERSAEAFAVLERAVNAARVVYYRLAGRVGSPEDAHARAVISMLGDRRTRAPFRPLAARAADEGVGHGGR